MREYRGSEIRNIAVVGHGASGKTSLVDALAFVSGSSKRHGSVKDGTALTDYSAEEIERGFSINLGCAYAEWMDAKINLIDTPGFLDFQGDAVAGVAAADGALCVVNANSGVEVGTEREFREAMRRKDPVLFVVSMMDKEHADFDRAYEQIKRQADAEGHTGPDPRGPGIVVPGRPEPVLQKGPHLQEGFEVRTIRGDRHSRRISGDVRQVLSGPHRDGRGDGRLPPGALPGRRRDRARGRDSRDEGSDEAHGAVPAVLCLQRVQHGGAGGALHRRGVDAQCVRDGGGARLQGRRGKPDGRDPRQR